MKLNSKNYPYIGLFTNNPNDIRGLEFISIYKSNKEELYNLDTGNKILKYKYVQLFEEARSFNNELLDLIQDNNINDYFFQKWFYDFFTGFVDLEKYKLLNVFINYDFNQEILNNIKNELVISGIEDMLDEISLNDPDVPLLFDKDSYKDIIFLPFVTSISKYLKNIFEEFDKYYDDDSELTAIPIDGTSYDGLKKIAIKLNKTFLHRSFNNKLNESYQIILDINKMLNKKYELFLHIQKNNKISGEGFKTILHVDGVADYDKIVGYNDNLMNCWGFFLNINNDKCVKLIKEVLTEDGYGRKSKELFENDNNFLMFERFTTEVKKLNFGNMKFIIYLLQKLDFKIKIKNIKYIKKKYDSKNIELDIPKYIKFYESFDSWKKHQSINKKLNNQPHLKDYLDTCINIINRRIVYLNPFFENYMQFYDIAFAPSDLDKNINNNKFSIKYFKLMYKNILNLFEEDINDIPLDDLINHLKSNKYVLKNFTYKNTTILEHNYLNKLGLIMSLINNPTEHNLTYLSYLLNISYNFDKAIINI
jgi:hypothetical protein